MLVGLKHHNSNVSQNLAAVGKAIREARLAANLDQDTLAALAGVSRRPIYYVESGKGAVRLDSLYRILDALGLKITLESKGKLDV